MVSIVEILQPRLGLDRCLGVEQGVSTARDALYRHYADRLIVNPALTRSLVSFQANKQAPFYRWFKYKEAFSSDLVHYVLDRYRPVGATALRVLDPFAGAGTTLTTAATEGWRATGIELLPVGTSAMRARLIADVVDIGLFERYLRELKRVPLPLATDDGFRFQHIRITERAFPPQTEADISAYVAFLDSIDDEQVRYLFWFACLAVLEEVSYTRKDGQYLRWDSRSGRRLRARFDKGPLPSLQTAVTRQLHAMLEDIQRRNGGTVSRNVDVIEGSCLAELPRLPDRAFDLILTSPPYCNRYDYSRTYALELAFMGYGEEDVKRFRQTLLSATVENRTKRDQLAVQYAAR
jgi:hypothetical protein